MFWLSAVNTSMRASVTTVLVVKLPKAALKALGAGKREWIRFVFTARNGLGTTGLRPRIRHVRVIR
jgi:hypothetical protein